MTSILRLGLFLLCLIPFAVVVYATLANTLGPDPAETIMHVTGEWAARMLLLTLLISPLRQWTGWAVLLKYRRMLGLYTFFYAVIHLVTFGHFYLGWSAELLLEELGERPYITVGFAALILMLPLGLTSTRSMQRRLGKQWQRLHRLVYGAAALVCVHMLWQIRSDAGEALLYSALFAGLLGWRLVRYLQKRKKQPQSGAFSGAS